MGTAERVVGENAAKPGCHDCICALLFLANVVVILILFVLWVSGGMVGIPTNATADLLAQATDTNTTLNDGVTATALTGLYSFSFATVWIFIYLVVLKVAAWTLIIMLNLLLLVIWVAAGIGSVTYSTACEERTSWPGPCGEYESTGAFAGGIVLFAIAALHLLWLLCIRKRIAITAKMLKAVSTVLFYCPGTILVSYLTALLSIAWYCLWGGALIQGSTYLASGEYGTVESGEWVGILFGMFISLYWGLKVLSNISRMVACHVTASWYFNPAVISEGSPCCRPVTLVGLKRACINYLGSIAFGSLIVAILEAIHTTVKYIVSRLGDGNLALKLVVACFLCILNCLKRTIEWLTEWAYAYVAIYGYSFMTAGRKVAGMLFTSGVGALAQLTLVGPVLWLGRLIGAGLGVGAGFLTLQTNNITDAWSQPLIGGFLAFSITSIALSCVDAGNKAIYICYIDAPEHMVSRSPDVADEFSSAEDKYKAKQAKKQAKAADDKGVSLEVRP